MEVPKPYKRTGKKVATIDHSPKAIASIQMILQSMAICQHGGFSNNCPTCEANPSAS